MKKKTLLYVVSPCNALLIFRQCLISHCNRFYWMFLTLFVMLTERHTTQHTDKCTDRIIRLCTSVALDGLNSMERQVVSIVSIFITYIFLFSLLLQHKNLQRPFCLKQREYAGRCVYFLTQQKKGCFKHHLTLGTDLNERFSDKGQKGQEVLCPSRLLSRCYQSVPCPQYLCCHNSPTRLGKKN